METMWLKCEAPFAAFRWMQAGVYRATSPVIPPSAAWGLILNLAGIGEARAYESANPEEVGPPMRLAVGVLPGEEAEVSTLYQQLHSYPIGNSGKERKDSMFGNKYWIAPVRREILVDFRCVIGIQTRAPRLLAKIRAGLKGESERGWGLPSAGDNNLLFDKIEVLPGPVRAKWYRRLGGGQGGAASAGSCRLLICADHEDASLSTSAVFAPLEADAPPETAWVWTPKAPAAEMR